jgi:tetratricopeptide (TPR) repeat protein
VTLGDFGSADIRTQRARELAEDVTDQRAVAALYESLAVTRQEQGDYEAALTYAKRALDAYESLGLRAMIGSAWNTIGWVYVQREQFGRASETLAKAERIAEELADPRLRGYVLQTKAELELARGHAQDAVSLAQASVEVAGASERGRALSLLVKAQALARTRAPLPAVNAAFEAAFEALKPFGRRQRARAHESHFEALQTRGHFKEAAASAKQALELMRPSLT